MYEKVWVVKKKRNPIVTGCLGCFGAMILYSVIGTLLILPLSIFRNLPGVLTFPIFIFWLTFLISSSIYIIRSMMRNHKNNKM